VISNNVSNAKLLLKYGAAPSQKDNLGNTPMHLAVANKNLSLVRLLDEYNGDGRLMNIDGVSAIDIALNEDFRDIKLHFMS